VGATGDPAGAGAEGTGRETGSGKRFVDEAVLDDCSTDNADDDLRPDLKGSRSRFKKDVGLNDDLSSGAIAQ
jgi:hypothetical protein